VTDGVPFAVFSCDVDTVDRHLQGYGFEGLPPCDLVYRKAVPRILGLLDQLGVRGVFFLIARDASGQRTLIREMATNGHEIASHSLTHQQPFSALDDTAMADELESSRARLADAAGSEVEGFRAPAWDVDDRVLAAVQSAGYRYDASVFPTPVLVLSRLAAYRRSMGMSSIFSMGLFRHAFAPLRPRRVTRGSAAGLVEFPISVTRWLRFPVYHTMRYFVPPWMFRRCLRALLRTGLPVCYEFHAADVLGLAEDGPDPRIARHPGMQLPLEQKMEALREILATIAAERRVVTYRAALAEGLAG
jgi:hypothetical protein